jgi:hypothetical protein
MTAATGSAKTHGQRPHRMTWQRILLLATVLVAAFLRLYELDLLPPGLFYDEAYNGLDVRGVLSGAQFPLYFPGNYGREPLFLYLQSAFVALLGYTPYALRVTAAFIGILTIPVIYWAFHTLFTESTEDSQRAQRGNRELSLSPGFSASSVLSVSNSAPSVTRFFWSATIAAAGLAVSYWHVSVSRLGFRAILLPLLSSLLIGCFWRAWTGRRRRDFLWAGVWLGAALYTYTAARVLPLVLLAFVLVEAVIYLFTRAGHRGRGAFTEHAENTEIAPSASHPLPFPLRGLLLTAATALLVAAPLLLTFAREPALLGSRTGDISIFTVAQVDMPGTPAERFVHNLLAVAGNFYVAGDEAVRHNLPGRPVNDLLLAALFTLGMAAAIWRIRRPAMRLLLLWLAVMATPTLFAAQAPHVLRGIGMLPPLALLYGIGGGVILGALARWQRWAAPALVILILTVSGALTFIDYFTRWPQSDRFGVEFSIGEQLAADAIAAAWDEIAAGQGLVVPRDLLFTPNVEFAVGEIAVRETPPGESLDLGALTGVTYLVQAAPSAAQSLYLLQAWDGQVVASRLTTPQGLRSPAAAEQLAQRPAQTVLAAPRAGGSWPTVYAGVLPPNAPELAPAPIRYPLNARFGNGLTLVGYDLAPDRIDPGGTLQLMTFWRNDAPDGQLDVNGFDLFAHLALPDGRIVQKNGGLGGAWPPERWQAGVVYEDVRMLPVAEDAPPGRADVVVGLYDPASPAGTVRIGIVDANGVIGADQVALGSVAIQALPPAADVEGLTPVDARFEERIALLGYALAPAADGGLTVDLLWQALERSPTDYTAFVHLLGMNGDIVSQQDQPPGGNLPTTRWLPGETLRTTVSLPPPPAGQTGAQLRIGLYEPVGGRQLAVAGEDATAATFVLLPLTPEAAP